MKYDRVSPQPNRRIQFAAITSFSALVFFVVMSVPHVAHAEKLYEVLQGTSGPSATIKEVWSSVRSLVNYVVIAALIFVAFANILRININTYAIKKFLPTLVMAVLLANFSYFICRFMVDLSDVAMNLLINSPTGGAGIGKNDYGIAGSFAVNFDLHQLTSAGKLNTGLIWQFVFLTLLQFVGAVFLLILAFLFFIRNYIIYFLVALSPLAFMALTIPASKSVFNQWWSNFMKWTFMPIVSLFWLWLGGRWLVPLTSSTATLGGFSILSLVFAGTCFYLAITTPFKMGGAIMSGWNKFSKQALGYAGGDYAARKAKVWWAGQAASKNAINPLGHIARIGVNRQMAKEFDEATMKDRQESARANIRLRSMAGRNRTRAQDQFGGAEEKARIQVLDKYYNDTAGGRKQAEDKAKWLEEKGAAEAGLQRGLNRGKEGFLASDKGKTLLAERERINQDSLKYESQISELQKKTTLNFLMGKGEFEGSDIDKKILDDRILAMTRNLALDEGINKTQQDKVDKVMQSQMHLHNMSEEMQNVLSQVNKTKETVMDNFAEEISTIQGKIESGTVEPDDLNRLTNLRADFSLIQSGGTNGRIEDEINRVRAPLLARRDEIVTAAKDYYSGSIDELGGAIKGMVNLQATKAEDVIPGFEGLAAGQGLPGLGNIMMTRTGKLTSIQIKGDIDKFLDEKTVDEIADDLDPAKISLLVRNKMKLTAKDADGKQIIDPQAVITNFREGKQYLNDPEANREIEARMLALAKVAKQTSHADSPTASARLATMMSDAATIQARKVFNDQIVRASRTQGKPADYIQKNSINGMSSPNEVRSILESHMTTRGPLSRLAYSSVMRQTTMGASRNAGNYLSTTDPDVWAGNHGTAQNSSGQNTTSMVSAVVAAVRQNPDISYSKLSKTLGGGLESIAKSTDDLRTTLLQDRVRFADDLSKKMGITLGAELRPAFARALAQLPRNASADQIATKVKEIVPGSDPKVDPNEVNEIVGRAQTYAHTEKAIGLLSQTQNVIDHQTYIQHFSQMTPDQAKAQLQTLTEARKQVENIDTPTPEMLESVTAALQETGFATSQGGLISGPQAIDQLLMAQQAASAATKAYDQSGRFDLDKASDALAEQFINPEQSGNASSIDDRPGLHTDIAPPANASSPEK